MQDLNPCQWWLVPPNPNMPARDVVTLELVSQLQGPPLYAIRCGHDVLNVQGDFEYEPMPSSRDDSFMDRCRFATMEAALAAWQLHKENQPCNKS